MMGPMTELETALSALLATFVLLTFVGFYLARKYYQSWQTRQSKAFEMGGRQVKGDIYQMLGTFAALDEYEQIMLLSTTSRQGSLDLLGVKSDELHFIEFKKKGAVLQGPERKIKKLVDERKVKYVIKDVELPEQFRVEDRA